MGLPIMKKMKDDDSGGAGLGSDFLGPSYKYQDFIKSTDEMGMSGAGNFTALGNDIAGIISYSGLLIEGGGKARKGGPLGNRFFVKTGTKCQPSKKVGGKWKPTGDGKADRYLWLDNTTKGKIPFISGKSPFKGLVPGMMENMAALNPMSIMAGMVEGSTPPCTEITRRTGPWNKRGKMKTETHYVAIKDQEGFENMEAFENMKQFLNQKPSRTNYKFNIADKPLANLYNAGFGILMIYLVFQLMKK
jgi:hypothetical protein